MSEFLVVKKNLEYLKCPLLSSAEDWWMKDLLINSSKYKIQILEWLLLKLDGDFMFQSDNIPIITAIKKMTSVMSSLGLQRREGTNLLEGKLTVQRQIHFWEHLTDIVVIHHRQLESIQQDSTRNNQILLDKIAEQHKLQELFNTEVNLFPPDISKEVKTCLLKKDLKNFTTALKNLEVTLDQELSVLAQADFKTPVCSTESSGASGQLKLALIDFHNISASFFECCNHLRPWFIRSSPKLIEFGVKFQLICHLLDTWTNFTDTLTTVIQCCSNCKEFETTLKQGIAKTLFSSEISELNAVLQTVVKCCENCKMNVDCSYSNTE